jgi:hypothetical protein
MVFLEPDSHRATSRRSRSWSSWRRPWCQTELSGSWWLEKNGKQNINRKSIGRFIRQRKWPIRPTYLSITLPIQLECIWFFLLLQNILAYFTASAVGSCKCCDCMSSYRGRFLANLFLRVGNFTPGYETLYPGLRFETLKSNCKSLKLTKCKQSSFMHLTCMYMQWSQDSILVSFKIKMYFCRISIGILETVVFNMIFILNL